MMGYAQMLERKRQSGSEFGFEPVWMPGFLFDFQAMLVEWAIRQGRAAIFADCGLGKTPMGLVWASNVYRHQHKPVLYLTPLAVATQTIREAQKFGIDAVHSRDGSGDAPVIVSNYERLHYFDASNYAGVVCDESSILKSFDGKRRGEITAFMRHVPYRLLQTATAAPNDYMELGTSSEALGYLGHMDMLNRFFKNEQNNSAMTRKFGQVIKWRLKGHAELPFWRWVCSWARAVRKPSDLGFEDEQFILPPLVEQEHMVEARSLADGMLFALPAVGIQEQREERRRTIEERCEKVSALVNETGDPALVWCHLNDEGNTLERMIPDSVQVSGNDTEETKEDRLLAFSDGRARVLVTKPKIGAWGLNYQHCAHVALFPSHSFEQYYQEIRRCWRFGQIHPVVVDIVTTEGEGAILKNLQRKAEQADQMFSRLVSQMTNAMSIHAIEDNHSMEAPSWL